MALQAGSAYTPYTLDISGLRRNVAEAKALLASLRQEAQVPLPVPTTPPGGGGGGGSGGAGAAQRAADADLRLAQAKARLAQASGDEARALAIVQSALANSTGASERAVVVAQTQAARLQSGKSAFQQFGEAAKGSLLSIIGPAAAAGVALTTLQTVVRSTEEAFKFKARLDETRQSIVTLVGSTRDSNQVFAEAAAFGNRYAFTQREIADALRDSTPLLRTSSSSTRDILANLARLSQLNPEEGIKGAAFALNELVSGDVVSLVERFRISKTEAYAMRDAIRAGQDPIVVLGRYLDKNGISMQTLENRTQGAAGKMRELAQESENLQLALAGASGGPGLAIMETRINALRGLTRLLSGDFDAMGRSLSQFTSSGAGIFQTLAQSAGGVVSILKAIKDQDITAGAGGLLTLGTKLNPQIHIFEQITQAASDAGTAIARYAGFQVPDHFNVLQNSIDAWGRLLGIAPAAADATQQAAAASTQQAQATAIAASAEQQRTAAIQDGVQSLYAEAAAEQAAEQAAAAHAAQLAQSAAQSQIDAQAKTEQAARTELLTLQAQSAADAFIALHPNISASSAASLAAAQGMSPLIVRLIEATVRAHEARQALAEFNLQAGIQATRATLASRGANDLRRNNDDDDIRNAKHREATEALSARQRAANEASEAEARYNREIGNIAPLRARAQAQLDYAQARGDKAGVFNAMTALEQLDQAEEKAERKGRGRRARAGAAKLSDTQKLNNQLLASQEQYQNKAEDAELKHAQNILKIERDFQKKSLEQQRANEISKRQSRADFYDKLTAATKDIGGPEAEQLSAQYEAAFAEAQRLSASGNAKLGADYLALKQRQLDAELSYQQRLAELRQDGLTSDEQAEIERLTRIRELRRQAEEEELKQLLEGGDPNVNARNEALTEEARRYEEEQGKIADSADRAAEAKVLAALRSGKAIDVENAKLREQAALYEQIGRSGGPRASVAQPPAPSAAAAAQAPAPTTTPPGALAGGAEGAVVVRDADVLAALAAMQPRLDEMTVKLDTLATVVVAIQDGTRAVQGVERAVRSSGPRGVS